MYNFIRGYRFRESPNQAILIDGRQPQVSASAPSSDEVEHVIPTGTRAEGCKICIHTAGPTDGLSMQYSHRSELSHQSPSDPRPADQD